MLYVTNGCRGEMKTSCLERRELGLGRPRAARMRSMPLKKNLEKGATSGKESLAQLSLFLHFKIERESFSSFIASLFPLKAHPSLSFLLSCLRERRKALSRTPWRLRGLPRYTAERARETGSVGKKKKSRRRTTLSFSFSLYSLSLSFFLSSERRSSSAASAGLPTTPGSGSTLATLEKCQR